MRVDYHTHHYRCGHARGTLPEYVESAITAGLDEIGLSDHAPVYYMGDDPHPLTWYAMSQHDLFGYIAEVLELRARYAGKIRVRLGIESDYIDGWGNFFRDHWRQFPMDYVIGSIHWLGEWGIFDRNGGPAGRTPDEAYAEYLHLTQALARSGAYDIVGHLDAIKTEGYMPDRTITPLLDETVRVLAETGMTVELNTSGWRKPCAEPYPRAELLERCHHWGVPVTLGSDSHDPRDVGHKAEEAVSLLKEIGFREIATFDQRHRSMVPLD